MDGPDKQTYLDPNSLPYDPAKIVKTMIDHLKSSEEAACAGNHSLALLEVSRAFEHIPESCPAYHFRRIRVFRRKRDFRAVIRECDRIKALGCSPHEQSRALMEKAMAFDLMGDQGIAVRLYYRALDLAPHSAAIRRCLATLHSARGEKEAAREHYLKLIGYELFELRYRHRRQVLRWTNLGHLYRCTSSPKQAAIAYRTAIRLGMRGSPRDQRRAMEALRCLREVKKNCGEDY